MERYGARVGRSAGDGAPALRDLGAEGERCHYWVQDLFPAVAAHVIVGGSHLLSRRGGRHSSDARAETWNSHGSDWRRVLRIVLSASAMGRYWIGFKSACRCTVSTVQSPMRTRIPAISHG